MDLLSIAASVVGLVSVGYKVKSLGFDFFHDIPDRPPFSKQTGLLLAVIFPAPFRRLDEMNDKLLKANDTAVHQYRKAYCFDCSMTAVAGAIISQVVMTALSLPNLSQTHWTARASFISSLIAGCFSVYYACLLQRTVGSLVRPVDFKEWLTREEHFPSMKVLLEVHQSLRWAQRQHRGELGDLPDLAALSIGDSELPQSASFWSVLLLELPSYMINISLSFLLTGLGVYLGFTWAKDLDPIAGVGSSHNVFIVFVVCVGFCLTIYGIPAQYKHLEARPAILYRKILDAAENEGMSLTQVTATGENRNEANNSSTDIQNSPSR